MQEPGQKGGSQKLKHSRVLRCGTEVVGLSLDLDCRGAECT